jgi:hypothetical protein
MFYFLIPEGICFAGFTCTWLPLACFQQQEKASRGTHAKDTAKLTRKTEQQKSTNANVTCNHVQVKPAKQIPSGIRK